MTRIKEHPSYDRKDLPQTSAWYIQCSRRDALSDRAFARCAMLRVGSSLQFLEQFSLNLARSAKIDKALASLVNNPISPIKSFNQMSNNKITSFKSPSTDYHPSTCSGDISPPPLSDQ